MTELSGTDEIRGALRSRLSVNGAAWLEEALQRTAVRQDAIRALFPAAGRNCGRGALVHGTAAAPEGGLDDWTVDDGARALLLARLPLRGRELGDEVAGLYRHGDAAEKRGVLRGLSALPEEPELVRAALPLVRDALRSNDTRLIAAAMGRFGARNLDAHTYRHGVLKCVFLGIPLGSVHGLEERADAELARMLTDHARERAAAGREVPPDVWRVVNPNESNPLREA
ncbi:MULTISPECIES: EboA domain-containing protein [unclassified Actinopolyspora]|uniref:EboA domain-containing protein n=1 Tax=Actinopolyspora TaxID=1849 RepID=UPI0013F5D183|nr:MULTISPECIES: EboA domain-containing protein [unclassified Actinopolyspora]NHD19106.1 sugar phosphate isomerase [Actinopolyspora sp. BKK2]NHE78109.1 sugar phosphate isomerase [Actinopolyspora sp. BKK1]